MNAIEEIKQKLEKYPHLKYEETSNSISIYPENEAGFIITLEENSTNYTVAFDSWHEIFEDKEEALNCLAFGLSDSCRLKISSKGTTPYKWEVQAEENNEWFTDSETGLIFIPFWRKSVITYKQNNVLKE